MTYSCTVTKDGNTIWKGSVFDCPATSDEIILSHGGSVVHGQSGTCNNGRISGLVVGTENNSYTSHLRVLVGPEMVDRNISCSHEIGGQTTEIGSTNLTITRGKYYGFLYRHVSSVLYLLYHALQ